MLKQPVELQPSRSGFGARLSARTKKAESISSSGKFVSALLVLLLVYLWYASNRGIQLYDEGVLCTGAETVLRGGLPYRDFWTAYGPGQYYLLAGLFKLFGTTLLVARVYTIFVEWIVTILAYSIGRKLTGSLGGLVSSVTVAVWLNLDRSVLYPMVPALLFVLAGYLLLSYSSSNPKLIVVAGLLVGCAVLVRHDLGVYAFAGQIVLIAIDRLFGDPLSGKRASSRFATTIKRVVALSIGTAAVVLPVSFAFFRAVPRTLLYEAFIDFPFRIYPQFRSLPFSMQQISFSGSGGFRNLLGQLDGEFLHLLVLLLPLLSFFLVWILIVIRRLKKNPPLRGYSLAAGLALFGFGLYYSVRVRPDHLHMVAPMAIFLILFPWLIQATRALVVSRSVPLSLRLILVFCVAYLSLIGLTQKLRTIHDRAWIEIAGVERAKGILIREKEETSGLAETIRYIQQRTSPDQSIYVGNRRHDLILRNNALLYFLSDRAPATRYSDLSPGVATTARVQSEIINDLKSHTVEYIVLCSMPLPNEPNKSSVSSGVTVLDDFIQTNYQPVAEFGEYSILRRLELVADRRPGSAAFQQRTLACKGDIVSDFPYVTTANTRPKSHLL